MSWIGNLMLSSSAQSVWLSLQWVKRHKLNIVCTREYRDRLCYSHATIRTLPFDFAIKMSGQLYLVEFDGKQHPWDRSPYDRMKEGFCADSNIPLLTLREDDVGLGGPSVEWRLLDFLSRTVVGPQKINPTPGSWYFWQYE